MSCLVSLRYCTKNTDPLLIRVPIFRDKKAIGELLLPIAKKWYNEY